jgi:hypothetical protein
MYVLYTHISLARSSVQSRLTGTGNDNNNNSSRARTKYTFTIILHAHGDGFRVLKCITRSYNTNDVFVFTYRARESWYSSRRRFVRPSPEGNASRPDEKMRYDYAFCERTRLPRTGARASMGPGRPSSTRAFNIINYNNNTRTSDAGTTVAKDD